MLNKRDIETITENIIYKYTGCKVYCTYTGNYIQVWYKNLKKKDQKAVKTCIIKALGFEEIECNDNLDIGIKSYINHAKRISKFGILFYKVPKVQIDQIVALYKII